MKEKTGASKKMLIATVCALMLISVVLYYAVKQSRSEPDGWTPVNVELELALTEREAKLQADITVTSPPTLVNINTADAFVLELLPGIGPAKARAIVAHRRENGPFESIDALLEVNGIGQATLDNLREHVTLE